jgi:hypothetical protein
VPATVSLDNSTRTVTLQPSQALDGQSQYTATLAAAVADWRGTALAAPVTVAYVTGPGTPPVVTSTTPADGTTGVRTDAAVTATFNRRLGATTVTTSSFTLTDPPGAAVPAQVGYDDSTRTVTLTPNARLAQSTR